VDPWHEGEMATSAQGTCHFVPFHALFIVDDAASSLSTAPSLCFTKECWITIENEYMSGHDGAIDFILGFLAQEVFSSFAHTCFLLLFTTNFA
jgi:hypothetical protein